MQKFITKLFSVSFATLFISFCIYLWFFSDIMMYIDMIYMLSPVIVVVVGIFIFVINSIYNFYKKIKLHQQTKISGHNTKSVIKNQIDVENNYQKPNSILLAKVEQKIDNLDPVHFPQLIAWRKANRNRLIEVILNEMESTPNDSIGTTLACYESDLEHLSPTINRKTDET